MVFCNGINTVDKKNVNTVTILILIDGFLQYLLDGSDYIKGKSHNPYFNRWFSAIYLSKKYSNEDIKSQSLF